MSFFAPNTAASTYSSRAYQAAKAAGASDAQAAQYAGSQNQYADNPNEAKTIIPGESSAQALEREKGAGLPVGGQNFTPGNPRSLSQITASAAPNTAGTFAGLSPTYISSVLGGSIPQAQAVTAGGVPSIAARGMSADPISAMMLGATPSTGDITKAISSNLMPQFGQQDQALNEQLASLGIQGGSSTGALAALGRQQQSQLTSDISPYVMQGYQLQEQNAQGNQQAYDTAQQSNQANNFATQQLNVGNDLSAQQQNQQSALGLGEFNANATNQSNQYNISNLLQSAGMDANTANNFLASVMGFQNQDWNNLLSANANLGQAGAAATSGASQPVYQQPSPSSGFANFGSAAAGAFAQPQATPPSLPAGIQNYQNVTGGANYGGGANGGVYDPFAGRT